jgi:hypothetical protein
MFKSAHMELGEHRELEMVSFKWKEDLTARSTVQPTERLPSDTDVEVMETC